MITIIIPFYNEEEILCKNSVQFQTLSKQAELIFVDGGSADKSLDYVKEYGHVYNSDKGRAVQMNAGANFAKGDILFFLHADTIISSSGLSSIEKSMQDAECIGGCFTQRIDKNGIAYRFIESFGNMRANLTKVFYGDQGIFVRKGVFFNIGGFPQTPIMEDVLFSKKLRAAGKTIVLTDKVFTSARRWEGHGIAKTAFLYCVMVILFKLGYSLEKIKLLYDDLR